MNQDQDINILVLVKGSERYTFIYNDDNRGELVRTLGRFAANDELSFSWHDAAVLCQRSKLLSQQVDDIDP